MKTLFLILFLSLSCFASDGKIDTLYTQVGDEVTQQLQTGMSSLDEMNTVDPTQKDWMLKRFFVRIQASFGFDVPFLASLKVVPEVEIIAEKN